MFHLLRVEKQAKDDSIAFILETTVKQNAKENNFNQEYFVGSEFFKTLKQNSVVSYFKSRETGKGDSITFRLKRA